MNKKNAVTMVLLVLLAAASAFAAVPAKMNFQGMLTDSSGSSRLVFRSNRRISTTPKFSRSLVK